MSNAELWELFPIVLSDYDPAWPSYYLDERSRLEKLLPGDTIVRINHIGSTAVPGLTAKPTIDMLMEVKPDTDCSRLIEILTANGYLFTPQPDNPPPHMMFMKGYTPHGFGERVFHLHVRYPGDWDELYFRDYLRLYPEIAGEYIRLKQSLTTRFRNDRDEYTRSKGDFVRSNTLRARKEFDGRYKIGS